MRINIKKLIVFSLFVGVGSVNALQAKCTLQANLQDEFWILGDEISAFSDRFNRLRLIQSASNSRRLVSKQEEHLLSESITQSLNGCTRVLRANQGYAEIFATLAVLGKRVKALEDVEELQVPNLLATGDVFFMIGFNPLLAHLNQDLYLPTS